MNNQTSRSRRSRRHTKDIVSAIREWIRSGGPEQADREASCFAAKLGARVPPTNSARPKGGGADDPLVCIPSTPIGIVDTLKARIDHKAVHADVSALLSSCEWKDKRKGLFRMLIRKRDALRLLLFKDKVMV